jgi:hypothetical protein
MSMTDYFAFWGPRIGRRRSAKNAALWRFLTRVDRTVVRNHGYPRNNLSIRSGSGLTAPPLQLSSPSHNPTG